MDLKLLQALGTALFIGALVGIERTHHQHTEQNEFAGLRTFILIAELGAVLGWVSNVSHSIAPFVGGLGCVGLILGVAYVMERKAGGDGLGMTTETAALVVYVLGGVSMLGHATLAVALAIVTAALLATKQALHAAVRRVSHVELLATLRLLFASFIVLPILPRHPIDPWQAINPYTLWLLVILISGLSMVGYVAVRVLGAARGLLVTAFFGGLASSTATTLTFARQSRDEPPMSREFAAGTLIAWTVMFLRVMVLVGILRWSLFLRVFLPCLFLTGISALFGMWVLRKNRGIGGEQSSLPREATFKNPFRLLSAIKFSMVFAVVLLATKLVQHYAPEGGMYWLAAVGGSTDVDATILSMAETWRGQSVVDLALARAIIIAMVANTVAKFGLVAFLGTRVMMRQLILGTVSLVGAAGLAILWLN
jgi:uncharacterized membrane protein (DUF4010 family)